MKPTGLPPLPFPTISAADYRRAWELWLRAAVERVRREAAASSMSGESQRGREEGAERVAALLLASLPEETT